MNPTFSSYPASRLDNDDTSHSLSNNLAALNLNVFQQTSKKILNSESFPANTNSKVFVKLSTNGDLEIPLRSNNNRKCKSEFSFQNGSLIQEFIPRSKLESTPKELRIPKLNKNGLIINKNSPVTVSTFQNLSVASVPEFIPRGMSSGTYSKHVSEKSSETIIPKTSTLHNDLINSPFPSQDLENELMANSNITTYQENVNGTVYFYTAPVTHSNNTSPVDGLSTSPTLVSETGEISLMDASSVISPGIPPLAITHQPLITENAAPMYYVQDCITPELIILQPSTALYSELPEKVGDNYCNIESLEPLPAITSNVLKGYITSAYKATHVKTGVNYFLRRIHGVSLPSTKCNALVNNWKKLNHTNLVHLKEMIVSRDFNDNSLVFVYDYYPDSETLLSKHFTSQSEGLNDTFSSDPNAPRPYSHTKNALLRQQHSNTLLPESILWSYAIQLTGALRVIHAAGLSCRCLDASKVIITNRSRVRLSGVCVSDVVLYDHSPANRLQLTSHFQQEDLSDLGKLLLALACGSLIAIQKENLQTSLEVMSRSYSIDIRNLIAYLLHNNQRRSILELMPMIGARFYSQIDAMQLQCDLLESEIRKETDYGRLLKLVIKLACINEWPDFEHTWSENSDRYMLTLFRDYLYHQMSEDSRPWIDINQIIQSLSKLIDGSSEKVCLIPRNEESVLLMSYEEIKQCYEKCYSELSEAAAFVTEESTEKGQNIQDY